MLYPIQHKGKSALQSTFALRLARCKVPHKAHQSEMMLYLQEVVCWHAGSSAGC